MSDDVWERVRRDRARRACALILEDMEADVKRFDGQPLAELYADLAAAISALAAIITEALDGPGE